MLLHVYIKICNNCLIITRPSKVGLEFGCKFPDKRQLTYNRIFDYECRSDRTQIRTELLIMY